MSEQAADAPAAPSETRASLSTTSKVLTGLVVVSAVVPAAFVGNVAAKWLADTIGMGGPVVAIVLVLLAGIILGLLGVIAVAVATESSRVYPMLGVALLVLAAVSVWMFASLDDAREGLWVFLVTAGVLAVISGVATVWSKLSG
jgi:hypothetical protein